MLIQHHCVGRDSPLYQNGRQLAENVFENRWNSPALHDTHDIGIVVELDGEVVANLNIQKCSAELKPLPSEQYFEEAHWRSYWSGSYRNVGEASSLAFHEALGLAERKLSWQIIFGEMYLWCLSQKIYLLVTVQRESLVRILRKVWSLPFVKTSEKISNDIPDDTYWTRPPLPHAYALDMSNPSAMCTFHSCLKAVYFSP